MIVVRFVLLAVLASVGASVLLYLFTRDRRYLEFVRKVVRFVLVFLVVFAIVYVAERLVLR